MIWEAEKKMRSRASMETISREHPLAAPTPTSRPCMPRTDHLRVSTQRTRHGMMRCMHIVCYHCVCPHAPTAARAFPVRHPAGREFVCLPSSVLVFSLSHLTRTGSHTTSITIQTHF